MTNYFMYMSTLSSEEDIQLGRSHRLIEMQNLNSRKNARLARESDLGAIQKEVIVTVVRAEPLKVEE